MSRTSHARHPRRLRVALFGSPAFALPTLRALHERHELVLVVSQPDKPAGRGMSVRPPPSAALARELGLELWQPTRLKRDLEFLQRLEAADLDVGVTAAYGRILPAAVFEAPRHGVLNVHASLLPQYRGAAPIQWALIEGREDTGVTIMQTEAGLDTGPVRLQRRVAIAPHEHAGDLMARLADVGAQALLEALELLAAGRLPSAPQDDDQATLAPLLSPEDGHVRWSEPAAAIYDRFRGVSAWPGTSFAYQGQRVKVTAMAAVEGEPGAQPGSPREASPAQGGGTPARSEPVAGDTAAGAVLAIEQDVVLVAAGAGAVSLSRVKPPGGREMSASAWANGRRLVVGDRLG